MIQLKEEYDRLGAQFGLKSEALVGGRSLEKQEMILNQKGIETVFGTVGRTKDAIEKNMLVLNQCYYVIVDEADSMFSMDLIGRFGNSRAPRVHSRADSRAEPQVSRLRSVHDGGEADQRVRAPVHYYPNVLGHHAPETGVIDQKALEVSGGSAGHQER